ncbi:methionine biosynthesis protein MetW [Syntrophus gentianae]|uniref:Methionine biosynthesis protein MetW n=1 Tax=Syntrophus gentianae TaxID=43775 RepID=A0A1H7XSW7_9BACT|nr:methionine biosynthesis protein MetW [Syntrophus gentianae]SEM37032.1 methionine biosynthesis protein MetW [Syntrophus gentianae]
MNTREQTKNISPDYRIIGNLIDSGARILDLGCGGGDLMAFLARSRSTRGQGIELNESAVYECVRKGLNVCHGDIESGLLEYPDKSFDYVILNQSLQEVRQADALLDDALRVGRRVIVGFPNFAWIGSRCRLFFQGRSPITAALPYRWYDSPNVRFLSINDFRDFCNRKEIEVLKACYLRGDKTVSCLPNLLAEVAVFLLTAKNASQGGG